MGVWEDQSHGSLRGPITLTSERTNHVGVWADQSRGSLRGPITWESGRTNHVVVFRKRFYPQTYVEWRAFETRSDDRTNKVSDLRQSTENIFLLRRSLAERELSAKRTGLP